VTAESELQLKPVRLKPGDTIGILGGGQFGPYAGDGRGAAWPEMPGVLAGSGFAGIRRGAERDLREYADVEALELFANDVDVITYEFENVPSATAMVLAARRP